MSVEIMIEMIMMNRDDDDGNDDNDGDKWSKKKEST